MENGEWVKSNSRDKDRDKHGNERRREGQISQIGHEDV